MLMSVNEPLPHVYIQFSLGTQGDWLQDPCRHSSPRMLESLLYNDVVFANNAQTF